MDYLRLLVCEEEPNHSRPKFWVASQFPKLRCLISEFHRSEGGMEAIQVVMILGFSSVVVLTIWNVWTSLPLTVNGKQVTGIRGWFQEVVSSLLTIDGV